MQTLLALPGRPAADRGPTPPLTREQREACVNTNILATIMQNKHQDALVSV